MEIKDRLLEIDRELSKLDEMVLDFTEKLEELGVEYVIVSGYVAILLGRSRGTEDIDIIVKKMAKKRIEEVGRRLKDEGYWCINSELENIYEMLKNDLAVRFAEKENVIPNFEVRFPSDEFERTALEKSLKVKLNSAEIPISPLELQIAYKLYLGSERDLEDALHLYKLFEEKIDGEKLQSYAKKLQVGDQLNELKET